MNYKIENWNDRTMFIFYTKKISFDEFSEIIDEVIKPNRKFEVEITSWTQAFSFGKDKLEIYFEHFYNSEEPYFSFELLPRGNNHKNDLLKLKLMIENLDDFMKSVL